MNDFNDYLPKEVQAAVEMVCQDWQAKNKLQQLWSGDATLWTNADEAKWLGWLNIASVEQKEIVTLAALATALKEEGIHHVVVLGMGGSSLCPDLLAKTFKQVEGYPQLHVLDSTDPLQISHLEKKLDLKKSIFIVSSKSGSTLEPNIYKDYFYSQLQKSLGRDAVGNRFIAITDPGTQLDQLAKEQNFRAVFHGIPSIGGRYSALSNFGMVPAALMGLDIKDFLQPAEMMAQSCAATVAPADNPGALLGIILGVSAQFGKDKITFIVSPAIQALGAWLEQLIAESTGKLGKGLIPIDQEPLGNKNTYGNDRVFVYIRLENAIDDKQEDFIEDLKKSQQVVVQINLTDKMQLGREFFRWEMATAVAGSILAINPFDQPDVEGSKKLAAKIIQDYVRTQSMPSPKVLFKEEGIVLATDEKNAQEISANLIGEPSLENYLKAHLARVKKNDYVNLSAFIEMSSEHSDLLQNMREQILSHKKVATCLGFGPRFLHSTGQDYKGGPNTGVFLQITADHPEDLPVPNTNYSFGLVIQAQAEADFEVLVERSRRVLRLHLTQEVSQGLRQLNTLLKQALAT